MKSKEQKKEIVAKLENAFKNASSAVFVHFEKINVAEETAMRRGFRQDGISYIVAKKSLIRRALDALGLQHKDVPLHGEVSVAFDTKESNDPTGPARRVWNFAKQMGADKLAILGGIFEGKIVGREGMMEIATIPPVPILRGMFVNVINSPIAGLAIALKAIADQKQA
ncbi:MAG: 50S ribosomal protein L10 [Parcubacteria group bacterium GW2011_GWA2_51_10]|nr:MAG: 50S ribosomal protein L10 [Parcubacteria group bacterium GW2011_GWA2_51_10]